MGLRGVAQPVARDFGHYSLFHFCERSSHSGRSTSVR